MQIKLRICWWSCEWTSHTWLMSSMRRVWISRMRSRSCGMPFALWLLAVNQPATSSRRSIDTDLSQLWHLAWIFSSNAPKLAYQDVPFYWHEMKVTRMRPLKHARQTVYAMARNLACQYGKNSWQCAWGCASGEIRATSWLEFWSVQIFSQLSRLVTTKLAKGYCGRQTRNRTPKLSNSTIFNDLQWPLTDISRSP